MLRLPLAAPLVRSHLFHAFPLAILAARGEATLPWILSTFVQLYQLPGGDLKFYVHPRSPATPLDRVVLTTCPWLQVQALDPGLLAEAPATFLSRCLRRGLYPQVDVDHGRLPWDGRRGYVHEILVCGVGEGFFEVLSYDPEGRFQVRRLAAGDLEAGIFDAGAGPQLGPRDPPRATPSDPEQVPARPRWFLYGLTRGDGFRLDVEAVAEQLWDYVDAADSSRRHRALWPVAGGVWGVAAVDRLVASLPRRGAAGTILPLRVLWEHKRLMALRFSHLEAAGHLDPALGAAAEARRLAAEAWRLRLGLLRAEPTAPATDLEATTGDLRRLMAADLDLYGRVLRHLDGAAPRPPEAA